MTNLARPTASRNAPLSADYALWLASLGINVFPLNPGTKKPFANREVAAVLGRTEPPAGEGGLKLATIDQPAIRALWARWPSAMIGIRTGSVSGLYVLDVDRKNGKDGIATINANAWTIPPTVAAQTPSGGVHYYFRISRSDQRRWKTDGSSLGAGLDRRGDDGYCVWYGADLSLPMAEPPEWMITDIGSRSSSRDLRKQLGTEKAPTFSEATKALYSIEPPDSYDDWRNISCAFRQAATGLGVDDAMIRLSWDGWCTQHEKNNTSDNDKLWRSIDGGTSVGWSYLRSKASPEVQAGLIFGDGLTTPRTTQGELHSPLDGYQNIIATAPVEGGKSTHIETVKLLHDAVSLAYDEFSETIFAMAPLPWDRASTFPRQWNEIDTIHAVMFANAMFKTPGKETVVDAVKAIANRYRFHQVRDYLNRLQWDGLERLPQMLAQYFGVQQSPYIEKVSAKFMIGAVARTMRPGCQSDHVLVLEGSQGTGKSTSFRILAGDDWFADELPDLQSKDAAIQIAGKWIIEISELSALKRSDVETTKKFMSRRIDRYRAPYERIASDHARQCVFVATTNDEEYLKDQTGNRRFWPVKCNTIDVEALRRDRDQLWAEARTRFDRGESWWLDAIEEHVARGEQDERREVDPWESRVLAIVTAMNDTPVTIEHVAMMIGVTYSAQDTQTNRRIAQILKRAGFARTRVWDGHHRVRKFVKPHNGRVYP